MTPHRCPVCEGRGTLGHAVDSMAPVGTWVFRNGAWWVPCHACDATGVVWEPVISFPSIQVADPGAFGNPTPWMAIPDLPPGC